LDNLIIEHEEILSFNKILRNWYIINQRNLPWRATSDPYKIWLSEIILQQTRVAQGLPYYEKFVGTFPTVKDLALADERDVLRLWQGLGYYSRARNLHVTAKKIHEEFKGVFPADFKILMTLKGLGEYTAAAIASFAFNIAVPAIDGNVYRVLSRIFGVYSDTLSSTGKKEFFRLGQRLIPMDNPATYNQAMIEFGALLCTPVAPDCGICPFQSRCFAYLHNEQGNLPVKIKKLKVKQRFINYLVVSQDGKLAMNERVEKGIWHGLYDFPSIETDHAIDTVDDFPESKLLFNLVENSQIGSISRMYKHILTHQKLMVKFWTIHLKDQVAMDALQFLAHFYSPTEIEDLPKPIIIDQYLKEEGLI
jgi:A/G-specific adenine glycosylase